MSVQNKQCSKCKVNPRRNGNSWCYSCKYEYEKSYRASHPKPRSAPWKKNMDSWFKQKLFTLKYNAKRSNREFTITEDDLRNAYTDYCPIFGIKLRYIEDGKSKFKTNVSVDRIDSTKGYIPGNIWIISLKANICKSDLTIKELRNLYEQTLKKLNDTTQSTV